MKQEKIITRSKIEWCTHVDTSIVGCNNNCPYCYGRKMVKPGFISLCETYLKNEIEYLQKSNEVTVDEYDIIASKLRNYKPVFLEHRYALNFPDKSAVIFMNPFSDISDYTDKWIDLIVSRMGAKSINKNHIYVFLTKKLDDTICFFSNSMYFFSNSMYNLLGESFLNNIYYGITFTKYNTDYELLFRRTSEMKKAGFKIIWSLEPSDEMSFFYLINYLIENNKTNSLPDWIIWGPQKPNKKEIKKESLLSFRKAIARKYNIDVPIFFKGIKGLVSDAPKNIKDILISWGKKNVCNFD